MARRVLLARPSVPDTPPATPTDPAPPAPRFPAELVDAYEPIALLGRGRAGTVWHARERSGRRTVALKVALRDPDSADIEWRRCQREARVARRLKHRHVAEVVDAGVRGDVAYCAWRFCALGTLAARQDAHEVRSVEQIVALVREIAAALEHAQDRGVWHGALSPHAVLLDSTGRCQVADFRIVQDDDQPEDEMPLAARAPTYHAPEQRPRSPYPVGAQVDQYALALIAYELLTGIQRETVVGTTSTYAHDVIEVPAQRELRPGLRTDVNAVLQRAMLRVPDERFPTIGAFADAFSQACALEPVAPPADAASRAPVIERPRRWLPDGQPQIRALAGILAATGGLAVLTALAIGSALRGRSSDGARRTGAAAAPRPVAARPAPAALAPRSSVVDPATLLADRDAARLRLGEIIIVPLAISSRTVAVVDDVVRGAVPRVVRLQPGDYRVALRDPRLRYTPAETTVTVTSGARITVNFLPEDERR